MKNREKCRLGAAFRIPTGDHAPRSGWWRHEGDPQFPRYVQRGDIMPAIEGTPTLWTFADAWEPGALAAVR